MNSRHLTGDAVDLFPVGIDANPWHVDPHDVDHPNNCWMEIYAAMITAAELEGVDIRSGLDFNRDGVNIGRDGWDAPHYEIPAP